MAGVAYRAVADTGIPVDGGHRSGQSARCVPNRQGFAAGVRQAQAASGSIEPDAPESRTARRTARRIRGVAGIRGGRRTRVSDRVGRAAGQDAHPVEGRHGGRLGGIQPGMVGVGVIQVAPQMRILVAIESVDLRKGIDGLAQLCREKLGADPFSGSVFIFRSRRATAIKVLAYDGQGFWMAQKRLSKGRFVWWPTGKEATRSLQAHQAQLLMAAGDPETAAAPVWRKVS